MQLERSFINFIMNSLDISISNTGYPVTAEVMAKSGIADRKKLRLLERKGHIHSVLVKARNEMGKMQLYRAYYTTRELPKKFMEDYGYAVGDNGQLIEPSEE